MELENVIAQLQEIKHAEWLKYLYWLKKGRLRIARIHYCYCTQTRRIIGFLKGYI